MPLIARSPRTFIALWGALFFCLSVGWIFMRPPYQSPDETSHHIRALSIPNSPFILKDWGVWLKYRHLNPLATHPLIQELPFNPEIRLSQADLADLRGMAWRPSDEGETLDVLISQSYSYPPLYFWAVFHGGQFLTDLFSLSPYASVYAYRVVTAVLAALLWSITLWAITKLPLPDSYRWLIAAGVLLNPMLIYMSGAVNPDAVVYPLSALFIAAAFLSIYRSKRWLLLTGIALTLLVYVKPTALVLGPAVACAAITFCCLRSQYRKPALSLLLLIGSILLAGYISFYRLSPPRIFGPPTEFTPAEFLARAWESLPALFVHYAGSFGWHEYGADGWWYAALAIIAGCHLLALGFHIKKREEGDRLVAAFFLLTASAFTVGTFFAQYLEAPRSGYTLQGRYFLPVALGFAAIFLHRAWAIHLIWFLVLIGFHFALGAETLNRYYRGDKARFVYSLPWGPEVQSYHATVASLDAPCAPPQSDILRLIRSIRRHGNVITLFGRLRGTVQAESLRFAVFGGARPTKLIAQSGKGGRFIVQAHYTDWREALKGWNHLQVCLAIKDLTSSEVERLVPIFTNAGKAL